MSRARESTDAIEKLYISMRHFFYRGSIKPSGASGEALKELLLRVRPEIYGSIADENKVEFLGLQYVLDRLPEGIEECSYLYLTSDEGYKKSAFQQIIPKKRRRICYRIDDFQMNIEILLGRSEVYDILTHLTFLYNEADKIRNKAYNLDTPTKIWQQIENVVLANKVITKTEREIILSHISSLTGRTFAETLEAYKFFKEDKNPDRFIKIIYYLGKRSFDDFTGERRRVIYFSSVLKERIGHHIYGEIWATQIKKMLLKHKLQKRNLHFISSNMHSVMNMIYTFDALNLSYNEKDELKTYQQLSNSEELRNKVVEFAQNNGMISLKDLSGANIDVQIIDLEKVNLQNTAFTNDKFNSNDVIIVFDYAFGEQAYEVMDELLKPYKGKTPFEMNVSSISIMGKAGILKGEKGDIMIPTAHFFEGTADNYPFHNELSLKDFEHCGIAAVEGNMVTVLGTSLQNKDVLEYFMKSSWNTMGLEMEGAHYQKAIQAASHIRKHINQNVKLRYAYYASDNPLHTGSTLASGALGLSGVKPTYVITQKILEQIFNQ